MGGCLAYSEEGFVSESNMPIRRNPAVAELVFDAINWENRMFNNTMESCL